MTGISIAAAPSIAPGAASGSRRGDGLPLVARVAAGFGGTVDGLRFPRRRPDDVAAPVISFLKAEGRRRLNGRLRNTESAHGEHVSAIPGALLAVRHLDRHDNAAAIDAIDPSVVSGRARGRALLDYVGDCNADFSVMGAYGRGLLSGFLSLGGATGKIISSCPVSALMAHQARPAFPPA